jgi:hypothetical protein
LLLEKQKLAAWRCFLKAWKVIYRIDASKIWIYWELFLLSGSH